MIRKTIINNQEYPISQSDVLGSGGEATVIRINSWAVKIYHTNQLTTKRVQKLEDLIKLPLQWPVGVYAPQHLALDTKGKVVGFAMPCMPTSSEVVQLLSTKTYRRANQHVNSQFIVDLFINAHKVVQYLHSQKLIIGDFNDLNVTFHKTYIGFIDVDSMQFRNYPCMVGTENFLDPNLYNIDLSVRPVFESQHDWYSFMVMLIRSILLTHPYGGFHSNYNTLPQRALARIPVFDSGVKYPKLAFNFDILNDDLKSLCHRFFKSGERPIISVDVLKQYKDSLATCTSCGIQHPDECTSCPQCSTINLLKVQRKTKIVTSPSQRTVKCTELLKTKGSFIWHRVQDYDIFAIALEDGEYILYKYSGESVQSNHLFSAKNNHAKFDIFDRRFLAVNQEQTSDDLFIFDTNSKIVGLAKRSVSMCHGERMFSCTKKYLIRVQKSFAYYGEYDNRLNVFSEQQMASVMENQTWFRGSSHQDIIFGYQRFFHNLNYFIYKISKPLKQYRVEIPDLDFQESIIDVDVTFSPTSFLFIMKTEIKGRTYSKVYVVEQNTGTILSSFQVPAISSDVYRSIHGKAFLKPSGTNGIVLHPADDGIVQEIIGTNKVEKQVLLSETEPFISESDSLIPYQKGILVVHDDEIDFLEMGEK